MLALTLLAKAYTDRKASIVPSHDERMKGMKAQENMTEQQDK